MNMYVLNFRIVVKLCYTNLMAFFTPPQAEMSDFDYFYVTNNSKNSSLIKVWFCKNQSNILNFKERKQVWQNLKAKPKYFYRKREAPILYLHFELVG